MGNADIYRLNLITKKRKHCAVTIHNRTSVSIALHMPLRYNATCDKSCLQPLVQTYTQKQNSNKPSLRLVNSFDALLQFVTPQHTSNTTDTYSPKSVVTLPKIFHIF